MKEKCFITLTPDPPKRLYKHCSRVFANDVAIKEEVMRVETFNRGNPMNELLLRNLLVSSVL
jgi:hypothetical protein